MLTRPVNQLGLVGYWPLDDGSGSVARDASGGNNPGTLQSSPTWTTGQLGGALSFVSASNQYVSLPGTWGGASWTAVTVSVWYKVAANTGTFAALVEPTDITFVHMQLGPSGNNSVLTTPSTSISLPIIAQTPVGVWHNLVITSQSGSTKEYLDGVQQGSTDTSTYTSIAAATTLQIGRGFGSTRYFNGTIDDVRIYNRALSTTDVTALYNLGTAKLGTAKRDASPTTLLTNGLVGYWTFDGKNTSWAAGTTADVSGQGNTGSLVSMSTSTSPVLGRIGQALSFNGTTSFVNLGTGSALNLTGSATISAWIKPSNMASGPLFIALTGNNAAAVQLGLEVGRTTNKLDAIWGTVPTGFDILTSTGSLSLNTWQHVAVVRTGSGSSWVAQLYINGVLDSTQSGSHAASGFSNAFIGTLNTTPAQVFVGRIDDVRMYNRALSATEIQQLYQAGGGTTMAASNPQALTSGGLVGYWSFDGKNTNWATGLALDTSGSGNNGSLIGMSTTTSPVIGKIGQALIFNATNYVSNFPSSISASAPRTVCAWVKTTDAVASQGVAGNAISAGTVGWWLGISSAANAISYNHDAGGILTVSTSIVVGLWYHVCATETATNFVTIYKNGIAVGNTQLTAENISSFNGVIGRVRQSGSTSPFLGSIDDVRIYNRALSAQEIQTLYNLGR